MKGWKAIASAGGLIVLIVLAMAYAIMASRRGSVRMPDWHLAQPIEKIDSESFELITKSLGEWIKLKAPKGWVWKNLETGEYTVVDVIVCSECEEVIPGPLLMVEPAYSKDPGYVYRYIFEYFSYKCPKCGKRAIRAPGPPGVGLGPEGRPGEGFRPEDPR